MNSCAITYIPADDTADKPGPPLHQAEVMRPADTILIGEIRSSPPDVHAEWLWKHCIGVFAHGAGKVGNFIFFDGHTKSKKWLQTLYPLNENNWVISPDPDPNHRGMNGPPGCQYAAPPGPDAKVFQTKECLAYQ